MGAAPVLGRELDPLAGTLVANDDIDRLIAELPLVRAARPQPAPEADADAATIGSALARAVDLARQELHTDDAEDPFSRHVVVRSQGAGFRIPPVTCWHENQAFRPHRTARDSAGV